ncbi:MAG: hypothetical protein GFH27_549289n107 [Chloroflexi bacterium AL-W]|nr:hypothetical protein [Chloroflexi bacterium AL-N1]NOK66839.1 hypothetical protein [Chloroflexi bacterium AL-N10]NOK74869.1 hypothetical protein [Chloroflexi bacterium AL-N5]NOK81442.1 hypothetical protein [Chloroflexi bacterium AL-W]NOK88911.1 hypothetical protein [Chloroflexi bacterium AL-N15]
MTTPHDSNASREELLEELAYLREFREKIIDGLYVVCNHDIKTPIATSQNGVELLLENPGIFSELEPLLKIIQLSNLKALHVLDTVIALALFEKDPKQDLKQDAYMEINIPDILEWPLTRVHNLIEVERLRHHDSQNKSNRASKQHIPVPKLMVNIPAHIPLIYSYRPPIDRILDGMTQVILYISSKIEIYFNVEFDDRHIFTTMGCISMRMEENLLKDFNQFPYALTGFAFYGPSLGLYLSWRMAQQLGGDLHFEIRDQTTHLITLTLPRETRRVHAEKTCDQR